MLLAHQKSLCTEKGKCLFLLDIKGCKGMYIELSKKISLKMVIIENIQSNIQQIKLSP